MLSVRAGTSVDPITPASALAAQAITRAGGTVSWDAETAKAAAKKASLVQALDKKGTAGGGGAKNKSSWLGGKSLTNFLISSEEEEEGGADLDPFKVLYGTPLLRKHVSDPKDLALCFSLILPGKTFDIRCADATDYDTLYLHIPRRIKELSRNQVTFRC